MKPIAKEQRHGEELFLRDCRKGRAELVWWCFPDGIRRGVKFTFEEGDKAMWFVGEGDDVLSLAATLKRMGTQAMREQAECFGELNDDGERVFVRP